MCNDVSSGITEEIKAKDQVLDTVKNFKFLRAIISDAGSRPEILSRISQATNALTRLKLI